MVNLCDLIVRLLSIICAKSELQATNTKLKNKIDFILHLKDFRMRLKMNVGRHRNCMILSNY